MLSVVNKYLCFASGQVAGSAGEQPASEKGVIVYTNQLKAISHVYTPD